MEAQKPKYKVKVPPSKSALLENIDRQPYERIISQQSEISQENEIKSKPEIKKEQKSNENREISQKNIKNNKNESEIENDEEKKSNREEESENEAQSKDKNDSQEEEEEEEEEEEVEKNQSIQESSEIKESKISEKNDEPTKFVLKTPSQPSLPSKKKKSICRNFKRIMRSIGFLTFFFIVIFFLWCYYYPHRRSKVSKSLSNIYFGLFEDGKGLVYDYMNTLKNKFYNETQEIKNTKKNKKNNAMTQKNASRSKKEKNKKINENESYAQKNNNGSQNNEASNNNNTTKNQNNDTQKVKSEKENVSNTSKIENSLKSEENKNHKQNKKDDDALISKNKSNVSNDALTFQNKSNANKALIFQVKSNSSNETQTYRSSKEISREIESETQKKNQTFEKNISSNESESEIKSNTHKKSKEEEKKTTLTETNGTNQEINKKEESFSQSKISQILIEENQEKSMKQNEKSTKKGPYSNEKIENLKENSKKSTENDSNNINGNNISLTEKLSKFWKSLSLLHIATLQKNELQPILNDFFAIDSNLTNNLSFLKEDLNLFRDYLDVSVQLDSMKFEKNGQKSILILGSQFEALDLMLKKYGEFKILSGNPKHKNYLPQIFLEKKTNSKIILVPLFSKEENKFGLINLVNDIINNWAIGKIQTLIFIEPWMVSNADNFNEFLGKVEKFWNNHDFKNNSLSLLVYRDGGELAGFFNGMESSFLKSLKDMSWNYYQLPNALNKYASFEDIFQKIKRKKQK